MHNTAIMVFSNGWISCLIAVSVIVCANGDHYFVIAPGGETCDDCNLTLSDVIDNPKLYLTSGTRLTFLSGTHILDKDAPVLINGVSNLTIEGEGMIEDGFHWTIRQSNVIIKCQNTTGGFIFNRSSVSINSITFTECGLPVDREYIQRRYAPYQNGLFSSAYNFSIYSYLWSSLYFIDSSEVSLFQVSVQNCSGSCLYYLNTRNIQMNEVYVAHGSPEVSMECCGTDIINRPDCVGGNVIFFYLNSPNCENENEEWQVTVTNSSFVFGAGLFNDRAIMAGVTFVNLKNVFVTVSFNSTILYGNSGGNFGGLSIMSIILFQNVSSLRANVYSCPSDQLDISFKVSVTNELLCRGESHFRTSTTVNISDSVFSENIAIDAAGLNIDTSYVVVVNHFEAVITFNVANTLITYNKATLASCIGSGSLVDFPAKALFFLRNVTMTGNVIYRQSESLYRGIPPCCIAMINTDVAWFENVTISDHNLTGIYSITSNLIFLGETTISNNTGIDKGGALILEDNSNIILYPNTTVNFINNRAQFGAAIYIYEPDIRAFIYRDFQLCVYQIDGDPNTSNSRFTFSGNMASVTGNIIYGGYVTDCLLFYNASVTPSAKFFSTIFKYNRTSSLFDISSNAQWLCFCENGLPRCNMSMLTTSAVYPGQSINVSVIPVGQDGGLTIGNIAIFSNFSNFIYSDTVRTNEVTCTNVHLPVQVNGVDDIFSSYDLRLMNLVKNFTLQVDSQSATKSFPSLTVYVPVRPCPPGFRVNASFICDCVQIIQNLPNVTCNIINDTITSTGNVWIGYDQNKNETILSRFCPFDFCNHNRVTFNILEPHLQCLDNRSGRLCGGCADGNSILLGTNECGHCPNNNFLSLLIVFIIAGILLVVLLIALNLTVSVGTINGLIFYANIVKIHETIFFPNGPVIILSNFISFVNLDLGIQTCFYKGMTSYAKVWLQFVFPFYIWVIIIAIIIISKYSSKLSRIVGSNAVPVLATLMLLTYTKLIRIYTLTIKLTPLEVENSNSFLVWAFDGNIAVFSLKQNLLFAFTVSVFFIVVLPFTVFAMVVPIFEKQLSAKCGSLWLRFLKPVIDAYSGPFNDSRRYWVGFGLVARVIIAITVPFLNDTNALLVVFFVVLFLLSLFTLFGGYYKNKYLNYLEVWTNLNLLAITVLALGDAAYIGTVLTVSLMLVTFICVILFHIIQKIILRLANKPKELVMSLSFSKKLNPTKLADDYQSRALNTVTLSDNTEDDDKYNNRFRESLMEYVYMDES